MRVCFICFYCVRILVRLFLLSSVIDILFPRILTIPINYCFGRYPLAAVMSAENKVGDTTSKGLVSSRKGDGLTASQPNNVASDGHEQEGWLEENENNFHHHIGNGRMRNGGYEPTSALDQVDDACIDPTSVHSKSDAVDTMSTSSFQRVALTFSTQGLGFISVPLLAYPLLEFGCDADVLWRVLLGVGALPGIVVLYLRLFSNKIRECKNKTETNVVDDEIRRINDNQDPDSSPSITVPKIPEESSNRIHGNGHDIMSSTLFTDASDLDRNIRDENDNELALVEHSYMSSDSIDREKQTEARDDVSNDPPMTPLRNRTPGL